jgi:hypothetical protein
MNVKNKIIFEDAQKIIRLISDIKEVEKQNPDRAYSLKNELIIRSIENIEKGYKKSLYFIARKDFDEACSIAKDTSDFAGIVDGLFYQVSKLKDMKIDDKYRSFLYHIDDFNIYKERPGLGAAIRSEEKNSFNIINDTVMELFQEYSESYSKALNSMIKGDSRLLEEYFEKGFNAKYKLNTIIFESIYYRKISEDDGFEFCPGIYID